jgi:hypothetical protein
MTRVKDALLTSAYASGLNPMLDLEFGAQNGWAPNIAEIVSNTLYVRRNLEARLLTAPLGFQYLNNPDKWIATLRAMIETLPRTIEGFNKGLKVETSDVAIGGGSEIQQDVLRVVRDRSSPSFGYADKYGKPMVRFLEQYILYLLGNPETHTPGIVTLADKPSDYLSDLYSFSALFYETDPTKTHIVEAWLCTNMYPTNTGDIIGKRELNANQDINEFQVEFTAITQIGEGPRQLAQILLDEINYTNANPYLRPAAIDDISPDVRRQVNTGYQAQVEELGANAIIR